MDEKELKGEEKKQKEEMNLVEEKEEVKEMLTSLTIKQINALASITSDFDLDGKVLINLLFRKPLTMDERVHVIKALIRLDEDQPISLKGLASLIKALSKEPAKEPNRYLGILMEALEELKGERKDREKLIAEAKKKGESKKIIPRILEGSKKVFIEQQINDVIQELKPRKDRASKLPGSSIKLDADTLRWIELLRENGYQGSLSDFINEGIRSYFENYHNLTLAVTTIEKDS